MVLQKWRNIGQFSALLARISDCWGAPNENCFTLSRPVGAGVHRAPCLEGKKEIPEETSVSTGSKKTKQ